MPDLKKPLELLLELPHPLPPRVRGVRQVAALENLFDSPLFLLTYDGLVDRDETNALLLHSHYAGPSQPIRTSFQSSAKIIESSVCWRFRILDTLQVGVEEPNLDGSACGSCASRPHPLGPSHDRRVLLRHPGGRGSSRRYESVRPHVHGHPCEAANSRRGECLRIPSVHGALPSALPAARRHQNWVGPCRPASRPDSLPVSRKAGNGNLCCVPLHPVRRGLLLDLHQQRHRLSALPRALPLL